MGPWWLGVGRGPGREERVESCRGDGFASSVQLPSLASPSCSQQSELLHRRPQLSKGSLNPFGGLASGFGRISWSLLFYQNNKSAPSSDRGTKPPSAGLPASSWCCVCIYCLSSKAKLCLLSVQATANPFRDSWGVGVALTTEHGDRVGFILSFLCSSPSSSPTLLPLPHFFKIHLPRSNSKSF